MLRGDRINITPTGQKKGLWLEVDVVPAKTTGLTSLSAGRDGSRRLPESPLLHPRLLKEMSRIAFRSL